LSSSTLIIADGGGERGAARAGAGGDPDCERSAADELGAEYGVQRDCAAEFAAGVVDYAGEDQSGAGGVGGDGGVPGGGERYGRGHGGAGGTVGAECDDADDGV